MQYLTSVVDTSRHALNERFSRTEPAKLFLLTGTTAFAAGYFYFWLSDSRENPTTRVKKQFWRIVRPFIQGQINQQMTHAKEELQKDLIVTQQGERFFTVLPEVGLTKKEIEEQIALINKEDKVKVNEGRASGCVYHDGVEQDPSYHDLLKDTFGKFMWTNPLHADVFPATRKMEAEIVRMTCTLFGGDSETCGFVSSGGTESILMAIKGYRTRSEKLGISRPELVVPETAHAAFNKACEYFGIKLVSIPVDPVTRRADVKKMKRAINGNTIALVGSAPSYPHGVIDPIPELAAIAQSYGIGMHVDSCLGGFITAFMKEAGFDHTPCDFSVPGVTSISADTHKYAYAPKGSSVLMWKTKEWRSYQYFTATDWPGGIYFSPGVAGSRVGGIIATTWVSLLYHGKQKYVEATRKIVTTTRFLEKELNAIPHIFVFGKADTSVVGFGSKDFNILQLSSYLSKKGWSLSTLQFPSSIHLSVTLMHTKPGVAEALIADVKAGVDEIVKNPNRKLDGSAALYGTAATLPDRTIIEDVGKLVLDVIYTAYDGKKYI